MDDSIATASRDVLAINRRKATYLAFLALRKLSNAAFSRPGGGSTLLLYPKVERQSTLPDLINRLAWYLPAETVEDHRIYVPVADDIDRTMPTTAPESQEFYDRAHLDIKFIDPAGANAVIGDIDRILCHDFYRAIGPTLLRNLSRVEIVDPEFYSTTECSTWPKTLDNCRTADEDLSSEIFRRLEDQSAGIDSAYVFATGPSLDEAYDFEFPEDSLKIVCNSIVNSDDLLSHIDPDVLVFSDPVFHFGPNQYAHEFREDAVETIREYDCVAAIPDFQRSLLTGHYRDIVDHVVGFDYIKSDEPLYPAHDSLTVKSTGNIMTLLMLPIASALADDVYIIGADGREEDESYFWEHNDDAQYDDKLMQTVVDTHPSFFRDRIYTDYYEQHDETLTEMIEHGESRGVEYTSLTESYIPCLQERYGSKTDS